MREALLRAAAGLLAIILLTAFFFAVFGDRQPPQSWSADESVPEGYSESWEYPMVFLAAFFCDSIPLAWIAVRGLHGRKSRLMLWALLLHLVIGAILLPGLLLDFEEATGTTLMLVLPLQLIWLGYYLAVLGSHYLRDLLPSRVDRSGSW